MKATAKKVLAVMLSVAMLMSCAVFSFSANAAATLMWENHFDNGTADNWMSLYGGESDQNMYNSGRIGAGQENYAVLKTEGNNSYMELGFNNYNAFNRLSGFRVFHEGTTSKNPADVGKYGYAGGYQYSSTAKGLFLPQTGKYAITIDYKLIALNTTANAGLDVCASIGTVNWSNNIGLRGGNIESNGATPHVIATVSAADVGTDWRTATVYIDVDSDAGVELNIFAKAKSGYTSSLTGSKVLVDNVRIYSYTEASDFSTVTFYLNGNKVGEATGTVGDPFTMPTLSGVSADAQYTYFSDAALNNDIDLPTVYPAGNMDIYLAAKQPVVLMWENHFDNGTASNWLKSYGAENGNSHFNSGRVGLGVDSKDKNITYYNYAVHKEDTANDNGYMALGFKSDYAHRRISDFILFHEQNTSKTVAPGTYGHVGKYRYSTVGSFQPDSGKYAIKFDYKLASMVETEGTEIDLYIGFGSYLCSQDLTKYYLDNNTKCAYEKILTVTKDDLAAGWQNAVCYVDLDVPADQYWYTHFFVRTDNTSLSLNGSEVLVDNIEIYKYQSATDLPTYTFYHEGVKVGSTSGLEGSAFTMPELTLMLPSGGRYAFYADEACTQPLTLPTVFGTDSKKVYVAIEQIILPTDTVMWENAFDNGSATNWLSRYGTANGNSAFNSGRTETDNKNYAVHKTSGNNSYMALGFGNEGASNFASGFILSHQNTTHQDYKKPGYVGNYEGTNYAVGNFAPPIGGYKIDLRYQLASLPDGAAVDVYVAFGEGNNYWNGAQALSKFKNYQKLFTATSADLGAGWNSATAYIESTTGNEMHFFAVRANGNTVSLEGAEVWVDDIRVSTSTCTSVIFCYGNDVIGRTASALPGTTLKIPELNVPVSVPSGYKLAYYSDVECTEEIETPTVHPNKTMRVYVNVVREVEPTWSFEKEADNALLSLNTAATTTIYTDRTVKHSGRTSARINSDAAAGSANLYAQMLVKNGSDKQVVVSAEKNYEITFWVYQPAAHGTYPINYWFAARNVDTPFNDTDHDGARFMIAEGTYTPTATDAWEKVTVSVKGCAMSGNLRMGLIGDKNAAHPFYIDDITVTEMSSEENVWSFDKETEGTVLSINTSDRTRTATVDSYVKYSGYHSLRINNNTKLSDYFPQVMVKNDAGQQIFVNEGRNYSITFRIMKPETEPKYGINYWFTATTDEVDKEFNRTDYRKDTYAVAYQNAVSVASSGQWQLITLEIKNCAYSGKLRFGISGDYNSAHVFYVDDLTVTEEFPVADVYVESFERYDPDAELALNENGATVTVKSEDRHSGDFAAKVVSTGNDAATAPQFLVRDYHGAPLKVEKGKDYRIKFWVVRPATEPVYDFTYWFAVADSEEAFTNRIKNVVVGPETMVVNKANAWQSVRIDIKDCPYDGILRMGITGTTDAVHTFYIDDIAAAEYTAGDPDPNAMNFEMYDIGTNLALNQYMTNDTYKKNTIIISDAESYTGGQSAYFYSNNNMTNNRPHMLVRDGQGNIVKVKKGDDFFVSFMVYIPPSEPYFTFGYWLTVTPEDKDNVPFFGELAHNPEFSAPDYMLPGDEFGRTPPEAGVWTEIKIAVMDCPYEGNLRIGLCHGNGAPFESHFYIDDIKVYDPEYILIKFDTNGSEDKYEDVTIMSEMLIPFEGNDPYREGYEFVGWYTDKSFSKESYIDITKTKIIGKTGDVITLYACWREWTENVADTVEKPQEQYKTEYYTEKVWVGDQNVPEPWDTGEAPPYEQAGPVTVTPEPLPDDADGAMPPWLIVVIIVAAVVVVGGGATIAAVMLKKNKKA